MSLTCPFTTGLRIAVGDHSMVSTSPRIGVLALQGDVREHLQSLTRCGSDAFAVRTVTDLSHAAGLVIPGGESTTMSLLARQDDLLEPLRRYREAGRPCFGSCAGLIFLADRVLDGRPDQESMGGLDISVRRNAFGRQVDSFESEVQMPVLGLAPFPAVFIRAPVVESIGSGVEILAEVTSVGGDARIVAVREGNILATAFHPELTGDDRCHQYFVDIVASA
jgi:pyridoxal 5'-phosphate synthase pdxT subunit